MASSVEPCESKPAGLTTLSSTLKLFDTFKPSQDEDKDSDEESFHLPLLGCDEDIDDNKEASRTATPNPENEDDILNKFDTIVTPDLDSKLEESILEDDTKESSEKDVTESIGHTSDQTESKDNSAASAGPLSGENEKTDVTRRLSEERPIDSSTPSDKEATLNASDNTEGCEVFKDLEVVDELDDSYEKGEEKTQEEESEICDQTITESKRELENMDVDTVEAPESENVQGVDTVETKEDAECDSEEMEETMAMEPEESEKDSEHVTKITEDNGTESEKETEHVTEKVVGDEKVEENSTEITVPEINATVDNAEKSDSDAAPTGTSTAIPNENSEKDEKSEENVSIELAGEEAIPEEKVTEESREEKMKCDDEEDDIINDIVKEVNDKLDSDDDEIMAEDSVVSSPTKLPEVDLNEDKVEECAELDEINSSACSNDVADDSTTPKPACEESNRQENENCQPESESAIPEKTHDTADRLDENAKEDDSCEKMDIDVPLEGGEEKNQDQQTNVEEEKNKGSGEEVESKVEQSTQPTAQGESTKPPAIEIISSNKSKSVDSSKSETEFEPKNSLECDDLLDVSIIRDVDEDNATAIAENANDIQSSEKSDNDEQDDDKGDNDLDESEADQEDNLLSSDKDDHIDSEEGNSNSCDQDTATVDNLMSENTSDAETKGDDDVVMKDAEESKSSSPSSPRTENEVETVIEKTPVKDKSARPDSQEKIKENGVQLGKRTFSEIGSTEKGVTTKKLRLSECETSTEEKEKVVPIKNSQMKTLMSFEKFMQNRKFGGKKLTRSDLEQFCLQKICEAIVHKTDVGELHQTIKKQEVIIENLRKDLQQLTKQTRDLDIVNKKLMNELRAQNGNKKPLVPLKITRSVGLQVKLNIGMDAAARRKQPVVVTTPSRTPTSLATNTPVNRSRNITPANAGVVRQVSQNTTPSPVTAAPSPRKTPNPILTQALQPTSRQSPTVVKRPAIRPRLSDAAKTAPSPGVIDLTDEDDKTTKTAAGTPPIKLHPKQSPAGAVPQKTVQQKTVNVAQTKNAAASVANKAAANKINKPLNSQANKASPMVQAKGAAGAKGRTVSSLPQGVRLTPTQLKNGLTIPANVVTSSASGTTQFMYVVQPSSLVTSTAGGGQKAVLLNFQPTGNGMLASTINGSSVSVIPSKTASTVQLKTVTNARKHPAALPLTPAIPLNASLKPLLPKPHLSIRKTDTGIILQWRMPYNLDLYEGIASYQLFAYQETNAPPSTDMWRKVGDVKALALPMACTLTQFADKNKYYFAVRSVDVHKRIGAFSDPEEISL